MEALQGFDWSSPNFLWVLFASIALGTAAAALGGFALLRGRSLLGDALAHAALPGVCLAFMFGLWLKERGYDADPKGFALLLSGALISGLAASGCIAFITKNSRIKEDAAQAIVLSTFFGFGITLLTRLQHHGGGEQSGLDKFLFGQAAALVGADVKSMTMLAIAVIVILAASFKEFKLLCFDPGFGTANGLRMGFFDGLMLVLLVVVVVAGLQAVGVVLISALLIVPAAAARFWTDKLAVMVPLAAVLGGLSGALGAMISAVAPRLPTGPFMVLAASTVFLISLMFAPKRGVLARGLRLLSTRKRVQRENVLRDLYELESESGAMVTCEVLAERRHGKMAVANKALRELAKDKLIQPVDGGWKLTSQGAEEAYEVVRRHRLWEAFLMQEASLGAIVADRDAEAVEHFLPPEAVVQLETWLKSQGREVRPLRAG